MIYEQLLLDPSLMDSSILYESRLDNSAFMQLYRRDNALRNFIANFAIN